MYSYRDIYLDLDPTYKDRFGRPLMRMTIDFHDNELKMSAFLTDKYAEILQQMGAKQIVKKPRKGPYDVTAYQTSHLNGGAIMGDNPGNSALNRYLQSWDVPNLFVLGASAFPQNAGYNPTGTVGALAYLVRRGDPLAIPQKSGAARPCVSERNICRMLSRALLLGACWPAAGAASRPASTSRISSRSSAAVISPIVGDCAACHTLPGSGHDFAGGRRSKRRSATSSRRTSRRIRRPASAPGPTTNSSTR